MSFYYITMKDKFEISSCDKTLETDWTWQIQFAAFREIQEKRENFLFYGKHTFIFFNAGLMINI